MNATNHDNQSRPIRCSRPLRRALLVICLVALPAGAQDPCEVATDAVKCFQATVDSFAKTAEKEMASGNADSEARLKAKETPAESPGSASTLRDYLPTLFTSLDLGTVAEEDGTLTLTFNPQWLDLGEHSQLSVQAVVRKPELFESLVDAIPEDERAGQKEALAETLEDFDDIEWALSWTFNSERMGRSFKYHRELIRKLWTEQVKAGKDPTKNQTLLDAMVDGTPKREQLELAKSAAEAWVEQNKALQKEATANHYFRLASLISNQPQFSIDVRSRRRDELVGRDEQSLQVSYEYGFANINRFKEWAAKENKPLSVQALKEYWTPREKLVDHLPRVAFTLSYKEVDAYSAVLDDVDAALNLEASETIGGSVTAGSYLRVDEEGNQLSRWDLEVKYEDVSGDPDRNNRLVSTLTYTQKVSGSLNASIGLVHASRPEYLTDVEESLSARVGLKYKLDRKDQ